MPTLYTKTTNDAGEEVYVETEVEITEDDVKQTEAYKKLLAESVSRRQAISDLKSKLDSLSSNEGSDAGESSPPNEPPAQAPVTQQPVLDEEALAEKLLARLAQKQAEAQQAQESRQALIARVAKEENVPASVLRGQTEEELRDHAKSIVREALVFPNSGGNGSSEPNPDDFWAKLDKKMGLTASQ